MEMFASLNSLERLNCLERSARLARSDRFEYLGLRDRHYFRADVRIQVITHVDVPAVNPCDDAHIPSVIRMFTKNFITFT